jgi:hypothetical protein
LRLALPCGGSLSLYTRTFCNRPAMASGHAAGRFYEEGPPMHTAAKLILMRPHGGVMLPSAISGLKGWYEADSGLFQASNGTTAAGNGDVVGYWTDQSGQGNHLIQATTSLKPTCRTLLGPGGTRPAVEFDGIDDYLQKTFTLAQPATVFLVLQQISWTVPDHILDGGSFATMSLLQFGTTPRLQTYAGTLGPVTPDLALSSYGIVTALFSGAASMIRVNAGTKVVASAGTASPGGVTLGARQSAADPSNIRVSALLVYSRDLSASGEDTAVLAYLNSKWAVY